MQSHTHGDTTIFVLFRSSHTMQRVEMGKTQSLILIISRTTGNHSMILIVGLTSSIVEGLELGNGEAV